MATASQIAIDVAKRPIYAVPSMSKERANETSLLLQQNHELYHIFFNDMHFHNHIVHHHLSLYALGASSQELQMQYKYNQVYQRSDVAEKEAVLSDLQDEAKFKSYLGKAKHYRDFVAFFRREIEAKGWKEVLDEYLFKGDAKANDMLVRLYDGVIHPLIHLGFSVEFEQPALVAETLAQTAVHEDWITPMMLEPEKIAAKRSASAKSPTFLSLVRRAGENEVLANSGRKAVGFALRDGMWAKASQPFVELAGEYFVTPATLKEQLAEMVQTTAIMCFASQDPKHVVKTDFFLIHTVNCSIFLSRLAEAEWLSDANKARLLEWKVRMDLAIYLSVGAPKLDWKQVTEYKPRHPKHGWAQIIERTTSFPEDGHIAKLVRALAHGSDMSSNKQVEDVVVGDREWLQMAHMAIDSTESGGPVFVRNSGSDGAWDEVPLKEEAGSSTGRL